MKFIEIPTLILNALNDPLLGPECYQVSLAKKKAEIILEMPKRGGHTGFVLQGQEFSLGRKSIRRVFTSGIKKGSQNDFLS